ncbi:MAG: hypothetical protein ACE5K4_09235 [Candidatus Hydrothermarchaeota archaeon]
MNKEQRYALLVLTILILSWIPLIVQKPLPRDSIPELKSEELFPTITGFRESTLSEKESVAVKQYTSKDVKTWIALYKGRGLKSLQDPYTCYKLAGWNILTKEKTIYHDRNVMKLLVEKNGEKRWVIAWYLNIFERRSKVLFFLPSFKYSMMIQICTPVTQNVEEAHDTALFFAEKEIKLLDRIIQKTRD